MKTFRQWALELAPPWLLGPVGEKYTQWLGLLEDLNVETALQAMKASKLLADTFHMSGLRYIGMERIMPRYPSETDSAYLVRLVGAWVAWKQAGTWQAIVSQLAAYGVTAQVYVQNRAGPLGVAGSGSAWDWDDDSANWSRFFVVITSHPWSSWDWGAVGVTYGDGHTWGSTATVEEVTGVREIIKHWKRAGMVFPHIIVDFGSFVAPTTGDRYDDPDNRDSGGIYWDGYGVRAY